MPRPNPSPSKPATPKRWRRGLLVAALLAVSGLLVVNWLVPSVRFTSVRLNHLAMLVAFLLPTVALLVGLNGTGGAARWAVGLVLVPVAAVGVALGLGMLITRPGCIVHDRDPTFVPVRTVTAFGHRLSAYRVVSKAPKPPGIVVREARRIAPGLDRVRRIGSLANADDVAIEPMGAGLVRLSYPPLPGHRDAVIDSVVRVEPRR